MKSSTGTSLHNYTLQNIIDSSEHIELINGNILIESRTSVRHNTAISELVTAFKNHFTLSNDNSRVFSENVALYVNELLNDDKNLFLPDIMVIYQTDGIKDDGVHVAPVFIAEVTSEMSARYDYNDKLEVYKRIGVEEYWIIDQQKQVIYKYLKATEYAPHVFLCGESLEVSSYPGLVIETSRILK